MPLSAFLLVLLAAVIHASWNLMAKRAAVVGVPFVFAVALVAAVLYAPWLLWSLWREPIAWNAPVIGCLLASGVIHLGYSICLQRGYQVSDLSVVYPVARGTGPLLSTIGAFLLLGETPKLLGVLGALLVVSGIGLIATQGRWAQFRKPEAWVGVRWGAMTGVLIASYTVVDAYGVKVLMVAPVIFDWCSNTLRLFMLAPSLWPKRRQAVQAMRGYWGYAIAVGAISPLGYILVLQALGNGAPLSLVAPMREMSMMIAAVLGVWLLREAVGVWRFVGCAMLVGGVVLLSAA